MELLNHGGFPDFSRLCVENNWEVVRGAYGWRNCCSVFEKMGDIRGHLKSSHIADKRKNFHMALYPLPPSSNESVIDNGRSVWQMALHIILVLPHSLPKQCRLSHVRRDASLKVQRPLWNEQGDMLEPRRKTRLFVHAQKWATGVDLQCRTGASSCQRLQPGLQKPIDICGGSFAAACMHLLPFLLGLVQGRAITCDTLFEISF